MLGQPTAALNDGAAAIPKRAACPKAAPVTVIEDLRRTGMGLIESGNNSFPGSQGFVSSEPARDRPIKLGFLQGVLESPTNSDALEMPNI